MDIKAVYVVIVNCFAKVGWSFTVTFTAKKMEDGHKTMYVQYELIVSWTVTSTAKK